MENVTYKDEPTVFITGQCNSNCIMCPCSDYERKKKTGMDDEEMLQYIDSLASDTNYIVVTGGEPTLRTEHFFMVMGRLADRFPNVEMLLLTNGRSFASKAMTLRLLEHCPPFLTVAIPLHGATAELHDSITRAPGSFRQTVLGIKNLLSSNVAVEIRVVVSKINCRHLDEIADLIISVFHAALVVNFIGLETMGNCAKNFKEVYIDYADSFQYSKDAVNKLVRAGINVGLYNYPLCCVDRGYWPLCKKSITPSKVRFPDECSCCIAKEQCGGFFASTLALANPAVKPIRENRW